MATIHSLLGQGLVKIDVPLDRSERAKRVIYGVTEFERWLKETLPNLVPGRLRATETPMEQVDFRLHQWISGAEVKYDRHFKDLMPRIDEVWEFKMVDVRIFGWMYRSRTFIAVLGEYADLFKGPGRSRYYGDAIASVKNARNQLALDEPKFVGGLFDELVSV